MTTTAPAITSTIPDLSDDALDALTRRLRRATGRDDVEILAITGAGLAHIWGGIYAGPGFQIEVAFTYTTGRRQRRTRELGWPINRWVSPGEHNPNLPDSLWAFLSAAVAAHGQPR